MKIYAIETDENDIKINIKLKSFISNNKKFELVYFEKDKNSPNILISQGSGGHAYVFAELGYLLHLQGYNVFIMPKHGSSTINKLQQHADAIKQIKQHFNGRIGVFSEGLGGLVVFYLTLAHGHVKSAAYQNAPAILTEKKFHKAIIRGKGAAQRRKFIIPLAKILVKIVPNMKLPISTYLNFEEMIDTKEENRQIETRIVNEVINDPDFDKEYPLSAIMSLIITPPPNPLSDLKTPKMFLVAKRGLVPNYFQDLYSRLPQIKKKLVEVDGSVFWMLSHPNEATKIISDWFDETL